MKTIKEQIVLLYYKFVDVPDPDTEVKIQRALMNGLGIKGRILIGTEGINGTLAGSYDAVETYISYMNSHPLFGGIVFKRSTAQLPPFKKLIVKTRPEIVTLGCNVNMNKRGRYITPEELHRLYQDKEDFVIIDMRNNYEYAVGRFVRAIQPDTKVFKELPDKVKSLSRYRDRKVITYCTGGIRCEKASALLVRRIFLMSISSKVVL